MNDDDHDAFRDKVCNDPLWAADEITRLQRELDELTRALGVRADRIDKLQQELDTTRNSANNWAYKMTLLVCWVRVNCTPEQIDDARSACVELR